MLPQRPGVSLGALPQHPLGHAGAWDVDGTSTALPWNLGAGFGGLGARPFWRPSQSKCVFLGFPPAVTHSLFVVSTGSDTFNAFWFPPAVTHSMFFGFHRQ